MKKSILIIISIFVLLIFLVVVYNNNNNKSMTSLKNDNLLAIYVDGVKTNSVPSQLSGYEFVTALCNNGTVATWDYENWMLNVDFSTVSGCSLYFKDSFKLRGTSSNILSQFSNNSSSADLIDKGWSNAFAYDGTIDNNLRYVGSNPKNYVQFNGELWRIIGVMNNVKNSSNQSQSLFKIIRADSLGKYSWDSSINPNGNNGYGINQWGESTYEDGTSYEGADLMRELNTDYLGTVTVGTDGKWYSGYNNQKTADMPSTSLSNGAQSMIESVVWHLGSPGNDNGTFNLTLEKNMPASLAYDGERAETNGKTCSSGTYCNDKVNRTSTWTGKVALPYISDVGFSTSGGSTDTRADCLLISLNSMANNGWKYHSDCYSNAWIHNNTIQWVLTSRAYTDSADTPHRIMNNGGFASNSATSLHNVRPVVYLKSNVSIVGGDGTTWNPYTLSLGE